MAEEAIARFGDELHVAWKLTVQRFLALQVHNSEHGRATLAAMREQLWARGEPSRSALSADARRAGRRPTCARRRRGIAQPTLVVAGGRDTLTPAGGGTLARRRDPRRADSWKSRAPRTRRSCRTATNSSRSLEAFPWRPLSRAFRAPDPRDVDPRAVRRAFARAAATYDAAAALQREVGARMASRLDYIRIAPRTILDAGCGTGEAVGELAARYAGARVVALDVGAAHGRGSARTRPARAVAVSPPASGRAGRRRRSRRRSLSAATSTSLPLSGVAFDLVWSNLALQWVNDLPRAFAEFRRVLKVGGLFTFTTFGPDTLKEIRSRVRARRRAHAHQPLYRHARHRRHAGRTRASPTR